MEGQFDQAGAWRSEAGSRPRTSRTARRWILTASTTPPIPPSPRDYRAVATTFSKFVIETETGRGARECDVTRSASIRLRVTGPAQAARAHFFAQGYVFADQGASARLTIRANGQVKAKRFPPASMTATWRGWSSRDPGSHLHAVGPVGGAPGPRHRGYVNLDVQVTAIVAVHGASVPRGPVVVDGVTVAPAARVPDLLRGLCVGAAGLLGHVLQHTPTATMVSRSGGPLPWPSAPRSSSPGPGCR